MLIKCHGGRKYAFLSDVEPLQYVHEYGVTSNAIKTELRYDAVAAAMR